MEKDQIKNAADFLGAKILSPLEENSVVGGQVEPVTEDHDHDHDHSVED